MQEQHDKIYNNLPASLKREFTKHSAGEKLLDFICADIGYDGALRETYLVLSRESLFIWVFPPKDQTFFSGTARQPAAGEREPDEFTYCPLNKISKPKLIYEVAGGLFVISISGFEKWICRFSGTKTKAMQLFRDRLEKAIKGEFDPPAQKPKDEFCPKCGQPYPEKGRSVCPRCMVKRAVFLRILHFFKPFRARMAIMLVCIALSGILNALWPYLSGAMLYDGVLAQNAWLAKSLGTANYPLLLGFLVFTMFLTRFLSQAISVIHGRMTAYVVPGVTAYIKNNVFSSMQRLSIQFYNRRQTGGLMQRVNNDANEVMNFFIDGLPYMLLNLILFFTSAGVMFWLDFRLALAALALLPPLLFTSLKLLPSLFHAYGRSAKVRRSMYSRLNDSITGGRVVRAFGQEEHENRRFADINDRVRDSELSIVRHRNRFNVSYTAVGGLSQVLVWCIGAFLIIRSQGAFTYGNLITFINYLVMLQGPMIFFSQLFQWWSNSMNAAQRIFEIIDAQPDITERRDAVQKKLEGHIELKGVNFSYEPGRPILSDMSFKVAAGEMLGIVGRSGAGKSTLVNLISRLYDPESGEILLDGVNVRDLSFSSLRGAVSMVSQETYIFIGTIAENIIYAKPGADRADIIRAASLADAHRFICCLPDGYDTMVGPGGRQLSGGERQRLSIARAILADPRILVLDEATSAVDTETEQAIQASLDRLVKGRTTLSIAHRLSTLKKADRLIVLDKGRITEQGTHRELMKSKGIYHKLYTLQTKALAMKGAGIVREKEDFQDEVLEREKSLAEDIIAVKPITADNACFKRTPGGFVSLDFKGKHYPRVAVHRCFAFTDPARFISIREPEGEGREIGLIEDMATLPGDVAAMLDEQMSLRYFTPIISKIIDIREEYGYSYWHAKTDRGACKFTVRMGTGNIYPIGGNRYLVNDIDGNRFEIPDLYALSAREIKKLDLFL